MAGHTLLNTAAGLEGWAREDVSKSLSWLLSPACHLLPAAHHASILLVLAVVRAHPGVGALQQRPLLPGALHIIQEDAERAPFPELRLLGGPHGVGEAELAAHHGGGGQAPAIVAHRAPLAVDEHLQPAPAAPAPALPHQPHRAIAGALLLLLPALPLLLLPLLPRPGGSARPGSGSRRRWGPGVRDASPRGLGRGLQAGMWWWCFHNKLCWGTRQRTVSLSVSTQCL